MIIGLCGPTDLYCLRRRKIAEAFCKQVFFFDELTVQYCRSLPVLYRGQTYDELVEKNDRAGIIRMKQTVEDGLRRISPRIYTDWMGNQLAVRAFSKGLKISTKVTEAVIGDVKYPEWARWLKKFATDKNNRTNRMVRIDGEVLPQPLCQHESETAYLEFGWDYDFDTNEPDVGRAVNFVRSKAYLNRSEE